VGEVSTSTRAAALPPDERRAAIIETTLPLLVEHGAAVTTRQIAEAAGIAEGTIFRAFKDKESLIDAVVEQALDPRPVDTAIRSIDRGLPLDARLSAAVVIIQERVARIWKLMSAVGIDRIPRHGGGAAGGRPPPDLTPLAELFEPDADRLSRDPLVAAQILHGLTFASSHPMISTPSMEASELVSTVLDGIRTDAPASPDAPQDH
jgi:AcrR family transcriptional regulator